MPPVNTIKPTVGRIVYYKTRGSADGVFPPTDFASIVTQVHSDIGDGTTVDLVTFGPTGMRFEVGVAQGSVAGNWDWMPFQKDQAARMAPGTLDGSHGSVSTTPGVSTSGS